MPIGAIVTLIPKPGAAGELRRRVLDVARAVRAEPGNLFTAVLADPENPEHVLMLEIFRDEAAIEEHKAAPGTVTKGPGVYALLAEPRRTLHLVTLDWEEACAGPS